MKNAPLAALLALLVACSESKPKPPEPPPEPEVYSLTLAVPQGPVSGSFEAVATPSGSMKTVQVEFTLDGQALPAGVDLVPPFGITLAPSAGDGEHLLRAVATREDGETASAEARIVLDNAGPAVVGITPSEGASVLPPGEVTVSFLAEDVAGVAEGVVTVRGHGEAATLDAELEATLTLPATTVFPVPYDLEWTLTDALGQQTSGSFPVVHTRERAAISVETPGHFFPTGLSDGRILVGSDASLASFSAQGAPEWQQTFENGEMLGAVFPATSGMGEAVLLVSNAQLAPLMLLRRVGPDGATVWEQPVDPTKAAYVTARYDAQTDSVIASRIDPSIGSQTGTLVRIDADGVETRLAELEAGFVANTFCDPGPRGQHGLMAWDTVGEGVNVFVFNAAGELLSSFVQPIQDGVGNCATLDDQTIVIARKSPTADSPDIHAIGPEGVRWSVYPEPSEILEAAMVLSDGTYLLRNRAALGGRLRWLRPDGTVVREVSLTDNIQRWDRAGDSVVVGLPREVRWLAPDGSTSATWRIPSDVLAKMMTVGGVRAHADGGAFLLVTTPDESWVWRLASDGTAVWEQHFEDGKADMLQLVPGEGGVIFSRYESLGEGTLRWAVHALVP